MLESTYNDFYYYFRDKGTFERYLRDVGDSIEILNENYSELSKELQHLVSQKVTKPAYNICINRRTRRIRGDFLHQMNKMTGKKLQDIEGEISKLSGWNGQGGIVNPRFPQGEELEIAVARIAATVLSDCTIEPNGVIKYAEKEMSRIEKVVENLRQFGEINPSSTYIESGNHYITHFPFVIGKMMMNRGIPYGDRTIQNPRLLLSVREGSEQVQRAYTEDFITQDGCIGKSTVIWRRACALNAGIKSEKYDFEEKLGTDEIRLIIDHGRKEQGNAKSWALSWGKLEKIVGSPDEIVSCTAKSIEETVLNNPNRLIHDEVSIVRELGVKVEVKPSDIKYYPKTRRVTAIWQAHTIGLKEAIKLGIVAPPNDIAKRTKMKIMISGHSTKRRETLIELKRNNIKFDQWWED